MLRTLRRPVCRLFSIGVMTVSVISAYWMFAYVMQVITVDKNPIQYLFAHTEPAEDLHGLSPVQPVQACVHPSLELWHPMLKKYFTDPEPLRCTKEQNWVYVQNGTFRINRKSIKSHGKIRCRYTPHLRGKDDFTVTDGVTRDIKDGDLIDSDIFTASCSAVDGDSYSSAHSAVHYNEKLHSRHTERPLPSDAMGMNILMFGFDSTSRMTWMRNLPKSHEYFVQELGGMVLEGYNIVGDGTPQALLPILTGKAEPELPEARRGHYSAAPVDGHPWIWKDLSKAGYVTQWGEDSSGVGTFTYRMLGFNEQPVDHYMRPFYMKAEPKYPINKPFCLGSLPRHQNMLNYMYDFAEMYKDKPKFSFVFHAEFTHDGFSQVRLVDNDLLNLMKDLEHNNHLNNTILIMMADHGARFHEVRQTVQGKYEERMPYFGFRFPPWFASKYPEAVKNFKWNTKQLTTPFDIHETLQDVLHYKGSQLPRPGQRGISLFSKIPSSRTCSDAGIETHWCACLDWHPVSSQNQLMVKATAKLVDTINSLTAEYRQQCQLLELANITSASQFTPNDHLLHFKKSSDSDGRYADLSDNMPASETFYQVTIRTSPSGAIYEGTIKHNTKTNSFLVNDKEISRINKYGSQPHCVQHNHPHLRPYCYCKKQLGRS